MMVSLLKPVEAIQVKYTKKWNMINLNINVFNLAPFIHEE